MIRGNDFDNTILVIELAPCTRNGNVCKDITSWVQADTEHPPATQAECENISHPRRLTQLTCPAKLLNRFGEVQNALKLATSNEENEGEQITSHITTSFN